MSDDNHNHPHGIQETPARAQWRKSVSLRRHIYVAADMAAEDSDLPTAAWVEQVLLAAIEPDCLAAAVDYVAQERAAAGLSAREMARPSSRRYRTG